MLLNVMISGMAQKNKGSNSGQRTNSINFSLEKRGYGRRRFSYRVLGGCALGHGGCCAFGSVGCFVAVHCVQ